MSPVTPLAIPLAIACAACPLRELKLFAPVSNQSWH